MLIKVTSRNLRPKDANAKRYDYFLKKTDEVFGNEFKGFEASVGEKSWTVKP